jgi:hypothetical protein
VTPRRMCFDFDELRTQSVTFKEYNVSIVHGIAKLLREYNLGMTLRFFISIVLRADATHAFRVFFFEEKKFVEKKFCAGCQIL